VASLTFLAIENVSRLLATRLKASF